MADPAVPDHAVDRPRLTIGEILRRYPPSSGTASPLDVYLQLLQIPKPSRESLLVAGADPDSLDTALILLHSRGLIDASDEDAIELFPPDRVVPVYAAELESQAHHARASATLLAQVYRLSRADEAMMDMSSLMQFVSGLDELYDTRAAEIAKCDEPTVQFIPRGAFFDEIFLGTHDRIDLLVEARLSTAPSLSLDSTVVQLPGALDRITALEEGGYAIRLTPNLPAGLLVLGTETALVDITNLDRSAFGSVAVRYRPLVGALRAVAEHYFNTGLPAPRDTETDDVFGISTKDRRILSLLALGASDSTIARQTQVSQRTVERRLRHVMDLLGAESRFQAGVLASRHGLI